MRRCRCFGLEYPPDGAADPPSSKPEVVGGGGGGGGGTCQPCAASPDWARLWCGVEDARGEGTTGSVSYMSIYETFYFDSATEA